TETVNLSLSTGATALLVIVDDESAVSFSAPSFTVSENGGSATIPVNRTGNSAGAVSVDFSISDGTALRGLDYTAQNGTLTFGPGETDKTITVTVLDDNLTEGNETVLLGLSNPTGGVGLGGQTHAVLTIVDDDLLPTDHRLTVTPPLGGIVTPPSGLYPADSVQIVTAIPEPDYQ